MDGPAYVFGCCVEASASGLLVQSPVCFQEGEQIDLSFKLNRAELRWTYARACVVRTEVRKDGGPWPVRIALRFDDVVTQLGEQLRTGT